jgi:methyl-accepting chemotaxis protein PixJ
MTEPVETSHPDFEESPDTALRLGKLETEGNATSWWGKLRLATKASIVGAVLGVIPVMTIGSLGYFISNQTLADRIVRSQHEQANFLADKLNRFMFERYGDATVVSRQPIFNDPNFIKVATVVEKRKLLNDYVKTYQVYDSIAIFDSAGNVIAQSDGKPLGNQANRPYFVKSLQRQDTIINDPEIYFDAHQSVVYITAQVREIGTGKLLGIVRLSAPSDRLFIPIADLTTGGQSFHIIDSQGKVFISSQPAKIGGSLEQLVPQLAENNVRTVTDSDGTARLYALRKFDAVNGMPQLQWQAVIGLDTKIAFADQQRLLLFTSIGTLVAGAIAALVSASIGRRATQPAVDAALAVEKIGRGEFGTWLPVVGGDEMALLAANVNGMAGQLESLLNEQRAIASRNERIATIARAREASELETPLSGWLTEVREHLNVSRAVIYRFEANNVGYIAGESRLPHLTPALNNEVHDACIPPELLSAYTNGAIAANNNVKMMGYDPQHVAMLERLEIKASAIVPIVQGETLCGLLIVHHCIDTYVWQPSEIDYLKEVAAEMSVPLSAFAITQRTQNDVLHEREQNQRRQMELMDLLSGVEAAADGDLTVRAEINEGEIAIVGDFFNSIIESLRDIVIKVKQAAADVGTSADINETEISNLATVTSVQAERIDKILDRIEEVNLSIEKVAEDSRLAAQVASTAASSAVSGGAIMEETVTTIQELRVTIAETAKKVKRLGESSQQISKATALIEKIALQTNLLAINASIEAARAGEEGRGFAVVAEEVGQLAAQSAAATKEIEQLVENIQQETTEVTQAMELSTSQVVAGSVSVAQTKTTLAEIVELSQQIDTILQSISTVTFSQAENSHIVQTYMQEIATLSSQTTGASQQMSKAISQTVTIARELQSSIGKFKVLN